MQDTQAEQTRNALCRCGSGEKYKRCCGSVAMSPAVPQAQRQFVQGVQMLRAGQIAPAVAALVGAIQADAEHVEAHLALGAALMQSGRAAEATTILLQAVTLQPDSVAANKDLAAAYDHQNLHEQAIAYFQKAVALAPKLIDVHLRLAQLYTMYSRMEEAAACLERAADLKPKTTMGRLYQSDAHLLRGDIAAAEQWARKAVMLDPKSDAANGTLAGLLYAQGRFEEAASLFETALRLNPKAAKCWDGLVHCRKYGPADDAILARMDAALQRRDLLDEERTIIVLARGKIHDDREEYARAMQDFDMAGRLRMKHMQFDRAGFAAMVDMTIARFTPDFIAQCAASGTPDQTLLFIVGMYRSGTTLAEQIVSSHPDIAAGGELSVWGPTEIDIDSATGTFDTGRTGQAIERYLSALRRIGPGARRVTDKLPTNFFRLGAIHALMPKARIIHCQRDPIDTCLSIYSTNFSSRIPYAARKEDLVFCYRQYLRIMEHWRHVLPPGIFLEVQYDRLITDRDAETRRMIAFTGLDWDESCLQPEQNRRTISTASAWQARQQVYTTSLQRWRRYEPWLGALRQLLPAEDAMPS